MYLTLLNCALTKIINFTCILLQLKEFSMVKMLNFIFYQLKKFKKRRADNLTHIKVSEKCITLTSLYF